MIQGPEALPSINAAAMNDGNDSDGLRFYFDSGNQRPAVRTQVDGAGARVRDWL